MKLHYSFRILLLCSLLLGGLNSLAQTNCPGSTMDQSTTQFPAAGGSGSFDVAALVGCDWAADTTGGFITIIHPRDIAHGPGTVTYTVAPNSGPPRTGTIRVGFAAFLTLSKTIQQDGTAFSLSPSPASQIVAQGSRTFYRVAINRSSGFGADISFSASGLPSGATYSFDFTNSSSTILTVVLSTTTPTGNYPITITGVGGGVTRTAPVTLTVGMPRLGFIDGQGNFLLKEGSLFGGWVTEYSGVTQISFTSTRIGILDTAGNFFVKEPGLFDQWVQEDSGVARIAVSNNRIGELLNDGTVRVKEGDLTGPWVVEETGATSIVLSPNRIGVLLANGNFEVKEGDLTGQWVGEYTNVVQAALTDTRIGVLDTSGNFFVKEAGLVDQWVQENGVTVAQIALNGDRIGFIGTDGTATVKEHSLTDPWVDEYFGVSQLELSGTRIGILTSDGSGTFLVKEGTLEDAWVQENSGATTIALGK